MYRTFWIPLCTAAIAVAWAFPSGATTVFRQELPQLVRQSDAIVHGHVRSIKSRWSSDHRRIFTEVEVEVLEPLKGAPSNRVTVQQPGGQIDNIGQLVQGLASFEQGEEVVLFLERRGAQAYFVSGLAQGKFHVDRSNTKIAYAVPEPLRGAELIDPATGQPTTPTNQKVKLDALRQTVRALVTSQVPTQKGQP